MTAALATFCFSIIAPLSGPLACDDVNDDDGAASSFCSWGPCSGAAAGPLLSAGGCTKAIGFYITTCAIAYQCNLLLLTTSEISGSMIRNMSCRM